MNGRLFSREDSDATGWISICDLYLLFAAVLLALGLSLAGSNDKLSAEAKADEMKLEQLDTALSTVRRLEPRAAELEEIVQTLKEEIEAERDRRESLESLVAKYGTDDPEALTKELARLQRELKSKQEQLVSIRQDLTEIEESLELERARVASLQRENESLETKNTRLAERASKAAAVGRLEEKITLLEDEITTLRRENQRLAGLASSEELRQANRDLEEEIQSARDRLRELESKLASISEANARFERREQDRLAQEGDVRQELLGLTGELGNAVFLMDRSQTMGESGRWDEAVSTLKTWLQHLPVQNAAVIAFGGGQLEAFPSRDYARRSAGEFTSVLTELDTIETGGSTNTHEAIEQAFRYDDLDSVILFTDGRPDGKYGSKDVLELVENLRFFRPNVKVHVIGVGDYFDGPMKRFLLGLREAGGGKFIGQ